jgi:hypothetical protein
MASHTGSDANQPAAETGSDAWIPTTPGERLVGELVDIDIAFSEYRDSNYPLLTVRTDDGAELTVHCFRVVLFNELMKWRPGVGERISIAYRGLGKAKAGMSPPHLYRVRVEGRSSTDARDVYRRLEAREPQPAAQSTADQAPEPDPSARQSESDPLPF